jgi:RNA polymerase sigma-70 factor (ECF subfamily)
MSPNQLADSEHEILINKTNPYPRFASMSLAQRQQYIVNYIRDRVPINSPLFQGLPHHLRDDVLQQVFIDLWENLDKYQPKKGAFATYAYWRIRGVVKLCMNNIRKHNCGHSTITKDALSIPSATKDLTDQYTEHTMLMEVLGHLESVDQQILFLKFLENKPCKEIADLLNVSETKIRNRLNHLTSSFKDSD